MNRKITKQEAISLRLKGKSYNVIAKIINVPKSTLSYWLKDIEIPMKLRKSMLLSVREKAAKNITKYNLERSRLVNLERTDKQKKYSDDIKRLSRYELKIVGTALYWAEGYKRSKWQIMFCNSDPKMVQLVMRFFREICEVAEKKFCPSVQLHKNISEITAKKYWSRIIDIPISSFKKTSFQISKSSNLVRPKFRLPYGTFRLSIYDVELVNKIKGWILGICKNI